MKTTIYLAGGMKSSWQDSFIGALPDIVFVDPRNHGLTTEAEYTAWDLAGIRRSSLVVAFMDSENPSGFGLSLEVGYAHALGLPVWYVCEDTTPRQRFFGMVRSCASRQFSTAADCIEALAALTPSPAPSAAPHQGADALPPFSELARLTQWLDAKFARHGEQEDADASKLLHTLWRAALTPQGADALREALTRLESAVDWHLGRSGFTQSTQLKGVAHAKAVRKELYAAHDAARAALAHHQAPQQGEQL